MKGLSIITPAWNSAATLPSTIASIKPLIDAGAEYILVDSGSEDGTVEIAKAAGAQVLFCPPGNMYAAINIGLEAASGEWLTYINSDDLLYSDAVMEMLEQADVNTDVCYGNLDYVDEVNRFLFYWRSARSQSLLWNMSCYCGIFQQGALFHRRVLERLKGFDTDYRFCADYDFFFRAAQEGFRYVKYTKKSVGAFRLLASQLSQARKGEMCTEGPRIRAKYWSGRSPLLRKWVQLYSYLERNVCNLDSRLVRKLHARGLDQREY
jgi:glycosyltransferase involved in cell wall biosynthesis